MGVGGEKKEKEGRGRQKGHQGVPPRSLNTCNCFNTKDFLDILLQAPVTLPGGILWFGMGQNARKKVSWRSPSWMTAGDYRVNAPVFFPLLSALPPDK